MPVPNLFDDGPVLAGACAQLGERLARVLVPLRLVLLLREPVPCPVPLGTEK